MRSKVRSLILVTQLCQLPYRFATCLPLLFLLALSAFPAHAAGSSSKWDKEIGAFLASDRTNPPPKNATLFVGSSSIRMWKTLAEDFPKHKVINRGFGGSQTSDLIQFVDQIVTPYEPRQILVYEGDNDIASGKTPAQVLADYKTFIQKVRAKLPDVPIDFIAIKPSPSRWHLADKIREANRLIKEYTATEKNLRYIDIFTPMLDSDGQPRPGLFIQDKLHLNEKGYALWRQIVSPYLK